MNKVIDKGFRSCRFVSTIVKHPVNVQICKVGMPPPQALNFLFDPLEYANGKSPVVGLEET